MNIEQTIQRLREQGPYETLIAYDGPGSTPWDALLDVAEAAQELTDALLAAGDTENLAKDLSHAVRVGKRNAALIAALAHLASRSDAA